MGYRFVLGRRGGASRPAKEDTVIVRRPYQEKKRSGGGSANGSVELEEVP
jgi:hypothetical protein